MDVKAVKKRARLYLMVTIGNIVLVVDMIVAVIIIILWALRKL